MNVLICTLQPVSTVQHRLEAELVLIHWRLWDQSTIIYVNSIVLEFPIHRLRTSLDCSPTTNSHLQSLGKLFQQGT